MISEKLRVLINKILQNLNDLYSESEKISNGDKDLQSISTNNENLELSKIHYEKSKKILEPNKQNLTTKQELATKHILNSDFIYGQKTAYIECLEIIQSLLDKEQHDKYDIDFVIENIFTL